MSWLDKDGVIYLWNKVKALFNKGITGLSVSGRTITYTKGDGTTGTITTQDTNTTYGVVSKSANGLAPKLPDETTTTKFLRQDGSWAVPPDNNTTYSDMKGATTSTAGTHGLAPAPAAGAANRYLRSDGTWSVPPDNNTTYSDVKGATDSAAGTHGLVPAPETGSQNKILTGAGTWGTLDILDTYRDTGIDFALRLNGKSISTESIDQATIKRAGVMSAADKTKLDALPTNATLSSTYAKKTDIAGVYKYKGSVADASKLPTSGNTAGDVYNIEVASIYGAANANVAWTGSAWDPLGEVFQITSMTNEEIDAICV